jgi:lipopolysaccharide cholinephosphotransferase
LEEDRNRDIHKGIFVDIFPGDRLAPTKLGQILQYCACAVNLLYSRGYTSKSGGIIEAVEKVLLLVPRRFHRRLIKSAQKFISKWNGYKQTPYIFPCTITECRKYYPATLFDALEPKEFSCKYYSSTAQWDAYLTKCYGDYMQLPPEEDRVWKHHPILIDFEHNYEELVD